jgi:hypothetical protein
LNAALLNSIKEAFYSMDRGDRMHQELICR